MSRIEHKYCLISTSYLAGEFQPRSQGNSSYPPIGLAPGGGKMRDPGNEVGGI